MSITDELRDWFKDRMFMANGWQEIHDIADHIDAEHERVVRERRRSCVYYDPERHYCSYHDFDVSGYVELPKDADGEYIHVGDVVVGKEDGEDDFIFEVYEIAFFPDGSCNVRAANDYGFDPWQVSHYHAPTVEDVLREFAEKITDSQIPGVHPTYEEAIAEYAQRLQLREVDE